MRLAVFTNQFPSRTSTFFARDMRALIEAGIEVDVFAIYPSEPQLWTYVPDILSADVLGRDRVHHLTLGRGLGALNPWRLLKAPGFLRDTALIGSAAARFGPVVLAKSLYAALLAWTWARDFGRQYDHVMAYWGNFPGTCAFLFHRLLGRQIPFSLWLHAQIDLYETPVFLSEKLLYADNVVTICEFNRRYIAAHYPAIYERIEHKIHVNYRGLDLSEFPFEANHRSARRVLAVGRLSPEKGYHNLLRAVAQLLGQGIEVELEFVGDGPERRSLVELAEHLRIADAVTFRGWLTFEDVRRAMLGAAVLAQPSTIEGLPTSVEEAMALGTPVVGSSVGGIPELLDQGRCGTLVPPSDVGALTDALQSMLTNPGLRLCYAQRARRRAEQMLDLWRNGALLADQLRSTRARAAA